VAYCLKYAIPERWVRKINRFHSYVAHCRIRALDTENISSATIKMIGQRLRCSEELCHYTIASSRVRAYFRLAQMRRDGVALLLLAPRDRPYGSRPTVARGHQSAP